jgi:TPR repeat protein
MVRFVIAALFTIIFNTALAGDFEDGLAAYQQKDYTTALAKFRSAAQQGILGAADLVGTMYYEGLGVIQDYKVAYSWYDLAAKQGFALSQFSVAFMYYNGQGVAQNYKEALRWFHRAARQGNVRAQQSLGAMYFNGEGVSQDYVRSHMWSNIAAVGGDKASVKARDTAASKMTAQQIEQAQRMARECMASNFAKCD